MSRITFEGEPKLPLKAQGSFDTVGWDISTYWAIDSGNQLWMSGGHSSHLCITKKEAFFSEIREDVSGVSERKACKALGLEVPWPSWARQAKTAGWTPPENWKP